MLNKVKLLLGLTDTSQDDLLNLLIDNAIEFAKMYTHQTTLTGLDGVLAQMVVYAYNIRGSEGLESESYSGASFEYLSSYPDTIIAALKPYRKLQVL